ncbi:MAG: RnfABCDGE type electron transport complex subunit G [Planctomycetota bacterium]|jgi:electron transport complex protein RnfG
MTNAPPPPPGPPETPAWRLVTTLGVAGTLAGLLLVFVFQATAPAIAAHKAKMLRLAIRDVLAGPERYDTLYVLDGKLTPDLPDGVNAKDLERVFLGYGEDGRPVGFAIEAEAPGFQDKVRLIFGYDAAKKRILGMKVLESKETPGLGDKIEKDRAWIDQFEGAEPPLVGRKPGRGSKEDKRGIDTITGATISSRAVIKIINGALKDLGPAVEAYAAGEAKR